MCGILIRCAVILVIHGQSAAKVLSWFGFLDFAILLIVKN